MAKRRTTASAKAVTKDAMSKEIKSVLFLGAGVVLGSMGGSMLDKMLKIDHTDTRMNLKKFIRPLVLIGAGTVGGIKLTDENMKNIAKGVAMSGILSGVKVILRKDLLSGLEGFEGLEGLGEAQFYDAYGEPMGEMGDLANAMVYYEPEEPLAMLPMGDAMLGVEMGETEQYNPILPNLEATPIAYAEDSEGYAGTSINAIEALETVEVEEII